MQNQTLVTALQRDLDRGEAETIALAVEIRADLALVDEREGRRAAQRPDVNVTGVVGLLLEAKSRGMVDTIHLHLDALRHRAGFCLSSSVYRATLLLAGEDDT